MASHVADRKKDPDEPQPGTWSWIKEYTGYVVTVLPYVSAGLVLIPGIHVWVKGAILFVFAVLVLYVRLWHEKAGIEVTGPKQREKKRNLDAIQRHAPHAGGKRGRVPLCVIIA